MIQNLLHSLKAHPIIYRMLLCMVILNAPFAIQNSAAQGLPFMRNFLSDEYNAHTRNYDILVDNTIGVVYVANFEGLIYYDNAEWSILHTPSITRLTTLYQDQVGRIWVGGYNYIGFIKALYNDDIDLQEVENTISFRGEVNRIWEEDNQLKFSTVNGQQYAIEDETIRQLGYDTSLGNSANETTTKRLKLADNFWAVSTYGEGIYFTYDDGSLIFTVTEENGLCSNNVNSIAYDGYGSLWGATDNGVFSMAVPSAYSRYTASEGLRGEVLSIHLLGDDMYVGTISGLFRKNGPVFEAIPEIRHACWQLEEQDGYLLAATSAGIFRVSSSKQVTQLTTASTTAVMATSDGFYSGEIDGVFFNPKQGERSIVSTLEKVTTIIEDKDNNLWLQNLFGQVAMRRNGEINVNIQSTDDDTRTIVFHQGQVITVGALQEEPFPYPQFSFSDEDGLLWLTDNEGKHLYAYQDGQRLNSYVKKLYPIGDYSVRALLKHDGLLWIGTPTSLVVVDLARTDPQFSSDNQLDICVVQIDADHVLWGGFGNRPTQLENLSPNTPLHITYALHHESHVGSTLFRTRLNNGNWSSWSESHAIDFPNLSWGRYTLFVEAMDAKGQIFEGNSLDFSIRYPFYLHWYMLLLYALILMGLGGAGAYLRNRKLRIEKIRLEGIVQNRTAEVVKQRDEILHQRDEITKQRDEIREKSSSLEKALGELEKAQQELIRQEKMATAGKLTQGLIDRILNPMNYINNFSKLSINLLKDLKGNIEDEQEHMSEENYQDSLDVLHMLEQNLEKVEQHGLNTSRILKAMEEILRDRSGNLVKMDLAELMTYILETVNKIFARDIEQYHILVELDCPYKSLLLKGNSEQLSRTLLSIMGNSIYALKKKAQQETFKPALILRVRQEDNKATIVVGDNGIGIERAILDKIFDPFFTTKTTSEASGVGLYLSQDIIQSHGGTISVESEKNVYTELKITLPLL